MSKVYFYKVRIQRSDQPPLFCPYDTKFEMIKEIINTTTTVFVRKNQKWGIGDVYVYENIHTIYFKAGRITVRNASFFDENNRTFLEKEESEAMTSEFLFIGEDFNYLCIKKHGAPIKEDTIAKYMEKIFNEHQLTKDCEITFVVTPIYDERNFIEKIRKYKVVQRISFSYIKPNPHDSGEILSKMEEVVEDLGGDKGKTEISGKALNIDKVTSISTEAIRYGDEVSVLVKPESERGLIIKSSDAKMFKYVRESLKDYARELYNWLLNRDRG